MKNGWMRLWRVDEGWLDEVVEGGRSVGRSGGGSRL